MKSIIVDECNHALGCKELDSCPFQYDDYCCTLLNETHTPQEGVLPNCPLKKEAYTVIYLEKPDES